MCFRVAESLLLYFHPMRKKVVIGSSFCQKDASTAKYLLLAVPSNERHKIANTLFYALAFSFSFICRGKLGYFGKETLGVFAIESWGISYWPCHSLLINDYFSRSYTFFSLFANHVMNQCAINSQEVLNNIYRGWG